VTAAACQTFLPIRDYNLALTLTSGQAFRWQPCPGGWEGVIGQHWVRLRARPEGIEAETAGPVMEWSWLEDYLQTRVDLAAIVRTFPDDEPMRAAVAACRGLRLLRQDPWECLASFILSATKQIVQIEQIVAALCARFGQPLAVRAGHEPVCSFPGADAIAAASETDLRACKMGFRAPKLLATARRVANGQINLARLHSLTVQQARAELLQLPGVGPKIADCVLLFAGGFPEAFPVDVWVMKALRTLYFPRRRPAPRQLRAFTARHFGPQAGYAQQYLFCYMRSKSGRGLGKA
jgi:N-glycosylase/DNA lyase